VEIPSPAVAVLLPRWLPRWRAVDPGSPGTGQPACHGYGAGPEGAQCQAASPGTADPDRRWTLPDCPLAADPRPGGAPGGLAAGYQPDRRPGLPGFQAPLSRTGSGPSNLFLGRKVLAGTGTGCPS